MARGRGVSAYQVGGKKKEMPPVSMAAATTRLTIRLSTLVSIRARALRLVSWLGAHKMSENSILSVAHEAAGCAEGCRRRDSTCYLARDRMKGKRARVVVGLVARRM